MGQPPTTSGSVMWSQIESTRQAVQIVDGKAGKVDLYISGWKNQKSGVGKGLWIPGDCE